MSRRPRRERPASSTAPVPKSRQPGLQRSAPVSDGLVVHDALSSPGRPLDVATRADMEPPFGQDFSQVRVHTDGVAGASAEAVRAHAYTVGEDIVFGPRQYAPASETGARLLAHELAHVAQNRSGARSSSAESSAESAAEQASHGRVVAPGELGGAGEGLQRAPDKSAPILAPDLAFKPDPSLTSLHLDVSTLDGFALNSSTLTAEHMAKIADLASKLLMLLSKLPLATITLTGHTDATGGEEYNLGLGQRRAEAVRTELVQAGVPSANIKVATVGKGGPVVKTQRAEPRNRRVEVRFEGRLLPPLPTASTPMVDTRVTDLGDSGGPGRPGRLGQPLFTLTPGQPGLQPPTGPTAVRPGAGDVAKAVLALTPVKKAVDDLIRTHRDRLEHGTTTGEKVILGATVVAIGTGTLAGIGSDPAARRAALNLLNGTEIPLPGTNGVLKVQVLSPPTGGGGAVLKFDLTNIIHDLK